MEYEDIASAEKLSQELQSAIDGLKLRPRFLIPDVALALLAGQVKVHADATASLCEGQLVTAAFPVARAAVEAMEDSIFLGLVDSDDTYALRGAKAAVGAELALDEVHQKMAQASSAIGREESRARPANRTTDAVKQFTTEWLPHHPDAADLLKQARQSLEDTRANGHRHWSGLDRHTVHRRVAGLLQDGSLGPVLETVYSALTARSHAGLHAPVIALQQDGVQLTLGKDNDQDRISLTASIQIALLGTLKALQDRHSPSQ